MASIDPVPIGIFTIAGLKHRPQEARDELNIIDSGTELTLVPEPDNKFDSNAIKILSPKGTFLGYIPRRMTFLVREFVDLALVEVEGKDAEVEDFSRVSAVLMEKGQDLVELSGFPKPPAALPSDSVVSEKPISC